MLAVPGPSGLEVRAVEVPPPVLAVEPANESAVEPAREQPPVLAAEPASAAEPAGELMSVPTAKSAAVAEPAGEGSAAAPELAATPEPGERPTGEPGAAVGLASESLSVLAAEPMAAVEPAAGPLVESAVKPAVESVAEPAAATAAEPAAGPIVAVKGRPVLAIGPVAASKECWVMNSAISPKVIVKRTREGSAVAAAAEAATPQERQAGEHLSELGCTPAAGRAAAESMIPPLAAAPRPAASAAAVQGKRKASAGVAEGSRRGPRQSSSKTCSKVNCLISKYLIHVIAFN